MESSDSSICEKKQSGGRGLELGERIQVGLACSPARWLSNEWRESNGIAKVTMVHWYSYNPHTFTFDLCIYHLKEILKKILTQIQMTANINNSIFVIMGSITSC